MGGRQNKQARKYGGANKGVEAGLAWHAAGLHVEGEAGEEWRRTPERVSGAAGWTVFCSP